MPLSSWQQCKAVILRLKSRLLTSNRNQNGEKARNKLLMITSKQRCSSSSRFIPNMLMTFSIKLTRSKRHSNLSLLSRRDLTLMDSKVKVSFRRANTKKANTQRHHKLRDLTREHLTLEPRTRKHLTKRVHTKRHHFRKRTSQGNNNSTQGHHLHPELNSLEMMSQKNRSLDTTTLMQLSTIGFSSKSRKSLGDPKRLQTRE